jgi:protein gp37
VGADSKIEWTDHTFNPWWGCTKVSPGCDHCYAELWDKRTGGGHWGPKAPFRQFGPKHWQQPIDWNKRAEKERRRRRVFCASMADVFDNRWPSHTRPMLFQIIEGTPHLDWLLLTKRIGNANDMVPARWLTGWPDNVWLGASIVNQEEANRDIPKLVATAARIKFLSCEPLLEDIALNVANIEDPDDAEHHVPPLALLDWVIVGGESGPRARTMRVEWAKSILSQCRDAGVPCFIKQLGSNARRAGAPLTGGFVAVPSLYLKDRKGGDMSEWPEYLRVREFPFTPLTNQQRVEP